MNSIQDTVLGIPGTPLPPAVGQTILNDADAATVFEQVNWLRSSVLVTPTGHLKRRHPRSKKPDIHHRASGTAIRISQLRRKHEDEPMTTMQLTFEQQCLLMHATSQVVEDLRALLTDEGILTTVERDRILALPPSYPETRRQIRQARRQPRADAIRKP